MAFGAGLLLFFSVMAVMEQPYAFNFKPLQQGNVFTTNGLSVKMPNVEAKKDKHDEVMETMKKEMQETKKEMKSLQQKLSETSAVLHKQCEQTDHMNSVFLMNLKNDGTHQLKFTDAYISSAYNELAKAEHLIDGNKDGHYHHGSCMHSSVSDPSPWVLLTLDKEGEIHRVEVTDRLDCCRGLMQDIRVEVFSTSPRVDRDAVPKLCGEIKMSVDSVVKVDCSHPVTGKYIRLQKKHGKLQACEVEAFGYHSDSKFGMAIQSSTVTQANLATDGDVKTCSETENEADSDPWWQVDLLEETTVTGLKITNRDDDKFTFLSNLQVSVYKTFPSVCLTSNQTVCANHEGTVGQGETLTLTCDKPMTGRYMRIRKLKGGALSLCDIRVQKTQ